MNLPTLPRPRQPRYPLLDLWRGAACLMVVIHHSSIHVQRDSGPALLWPNSIGDAVAAMLHAGWIGVPIFFVISGYCIAATSDSARRGKQPVVNYFRRRIRRILPPYWVALALTVLLVCTVSWVAGPALYLNACAGDTWVIPHPKDLSLIQWLGNVTLTEGWRSLFFGPEQRLQLGPAWTLCYEEQFYAVCGLVLAVAPQRFFTGIITVSILALGFMSLRIPAHGTFLDGNWFKFACGVLVYFHVNYASRRQQVALVATLIMIAGACVALRPPPSWQSQIFVLGPVIALVLLAMHPFDAALTHSWLLKPLRFCGIQCYSLYLVHWPIVKLITNALYMLGFQSRAAALCVGVPIATGTALAVGWCFHLTVERRFLNSLPTFTSHERPDPIPSRTAERDTALTRLDVPRCSGVGDVLSPAHQANAGSESTMGRTLASAQTADI